MEEGVPQPDIPVGLAKCKHFGIKNVVIEMDLNLPEIDYELFTMDKLCGFVRDKFAWIRDNLSRDSMIICNMRDFSR